jgi:hypothetical protein
MKLLFLLSILTKIEMWLQITVNIPNMKYIKRLSGGSRAVPCDVGIWTDGHEINFEIAYSCILIKLFSPTKPTK